MAPHVINHQTAQIPTEIIDRTRTSSRGDKKWRLRLPLNLGPASIPNTVIDGMRDGSYENNK